MAAPLDVIVTERMESSWLQIVEIQSIPVYAILRGEIGTTNVELFSH